MKLSELIEHLACLLTENGDIEVRCWENWKSLGPKGKDRKIPDLEVVEENGEKLVQINGK